MIDLFSILLTHGLMLVVIWRLVHRSDLNPPSDDPGDQTAHRRGWRRDDA